MNGERHFATYIVPLRLRKTGSGQQAALNRRIWKLLSVEVRKAWDCAGACRKKWDFRGKPSQEKDTAGSQKQDPCEKKVLAALASNRERDTGCVHVIYIYVLYVYIIFNSDRVLA